MPVYFVYVGPAPGHNMNAILTGDDITKFENWSLIEGQRDSINVNPGHLYVPETCMIEIRAPPKTRDGEQLSFVPILRFNIENKVASLSWINYDDPNLKIVLNREK